MDFWSNYLKWYEMWLKHTPYQQILLDKILPLAQGKKSFLDIGAGTGEVALAVAQYVPQVTCIEPAEKMRERILERAREEKRKVVSFGELWEEIKIEEIGTHELVLAAHSFYEMKNLQDCLSKMLEATEKQLLLMVRAQKKPGKLFQEVTRELEGEGVACLPKGSKPGLEEIKDYLIELGYQPQVEIIEYCSSHYYHSLDEAADHLVFWLNLPREKKQFLKDILAKILVFKQEHFFLPETTQGAFVLVEKGR